MHFYQNIYYYKGLKPNVLQGLVAGAAFFVKRTEIAQLLEDYTEKFWKKESHEVSMKERDFLKKEHRKIYIAYKAMLTLCLFTYTSFYIQRIFVEKTLCFPGK